MRSFIKYMTVLTLVFLMATMVVSRFAKKEDFNNIVIGFNKNNKKTNSDLSKALNISKEFLFSSSDDLTINLIDGDVKIKSIPGNHLKIILKGRVNQDRLIDADAYIYKHDHQVMIDVAKLFKDADSDRVMGLFKINSHSITVTDVSPSLEIEIPETIRHLDLNVVSANAKIEGFKSEDLKINAVGGDVMIANVKSGSIKCNSVSGDIELNQVLGHELKFNTVNGDVKFRSTTPEKYSISFKSAGGTISGSDKFLGDSDSSIKITTVSGDAQFY